MSARRKSRAPYAYPFAPTTTTGRIDQGQDFGGTGPVRAIGRAKIIRVGAPGWPGGEHGVLYKLLEGKYKGKYVFVYEGIHTSVRAGQEVQKGQAIGSLIPGSETGIETGWANAAGVPISHGEYVGQPDGYETKGGKAMARFLALLQGAAAPGGRGMTPAEKRKLAQLATEEGGNSGIPGLEQVESVEGNLEAHGVGGLAEQVLSGIVGDLAKSAEPLMLNIGLIGGGAFLIYYGAALMLGVKSPVATPLKGAVKP